MKAKLMNETKKTTEQPSAIQPPRKWPGLLWFVGFPMMILGVVITTMMTMNHLKQEPSEPLIFDLTLRRGYGGFIVYGAAFAIFGFILILLDTPRRRRAQK